MWTSDNTLNVELCYPPKVVYMRKVIHGFTHNDEDPDWVECESDYIFSEYDTVKNGKSKY